MSLLQCLSDAGPMGAFPRAQRTLKPSEKSPLTSSSRQSDWPGPATRIVEQLLSVVLSMVIWVWGVSQMRVGAQRFGCV
jgi:hypothetical protein